MLAAIGAALEALLALLGPHLASLESGCSGRSGRRRLALEPAGFRLPLGALTITAPLGYGQTCLRVLAG